MGRYQNIVRRIVAVELIAGGVFGAERPSDMFGALFFDLREKAKQLKEQWSQEAKIKIETELGNDLKAKGYKIKSLELSLGKYRGSRFVTSAKLTVVVKSEKETQKLLGYLQSKYSPKFKIKGFSPDTGEASYNVR